MPIVMCIPIHILVVSSNKNFPLLFVPPPQPIADFVKITNDKMVKCVCVCVSRISQNVDGRIEDECLSFGGY